MSLFFFTAISDERYYEIQKCLININFKIAWDKNKIARVFYFIFSIGSRWWKSFEFESEFCRNPEEGIFHSISAIDLNYTSLVIFLTDGFYFLPGTAKILSSFLRIGKPTSMFYRIRFSQGFVDVDSRVRRIPRIGVVT